MKEVKFVISYPYQSAEISDVNRHDNLDLKRHCLKTMKYIDFKISVTTCSSNSAKDFGCILLFYIL